MRALASGSLLMMIATALAASLGSGCSSSSAGSGPDAGLPVGVLGEYDNYSANQVGELGAIVFLDSANYDSYTVSDNDEPDEDSGTYVLDTAKGTLTLTSASTGQAQTLPFQAKSVSTAVTPLGTELRIVGGGGGVNLTPGGGSLTGPQTATTQNTACSANIMGALFHSASSSCLTQPTSAPLVTVPDGGVALTQCPNIGPFPSGISFTQVPDKTTSALYSTRLGAKTPASNPLVHTLASQGVEMCFVDMMNPKDGNGNAVATSVQVSTHYTLADIAWGSTGSDRFVKVDPTSVAALEAYARAAAPAKSQSSFAIYSGFRNPAHQQSTCQSVCGTQANPAQCTRCALKSQHMFGDAVDLTDTTLLTSTYEQMACNAGFQFVYNESNHLHVDTIWRPSTLNSCKVAPK